MKTQLDKTSPTTAILGVAADSNDLAPIVRSVFNDLRAKVTVKGFRPGKATNQALEREVGRTRIQDEVIEAAARRFYAHSANEHSLTPMEAPQVELVKIVPFTELELKITVEVMPPITLADYKQVRKQLPKIAVAESEIDQVIEALRQRIATRSPLKRAVRMGDEVRLDYKGTINGSAVPGATAHNQTVIMDSGRFIPGFTEAVIGMKPGAEKTFEVTFPKDYGESALAGKEVAFQATVHEVFELSKPAIDDIFAQAVGPFKNLAELRRDIRAQLEQQQAQEYQSNLEQAIVGEVVAGSKLELPDKLVQQQLEQLVADLSRSLARGGSNLEEHLKQQKQTKDDLETQLRPEAERRVKTALVLTEVAQQEGLAVTPDELAIRLELLRNQYQDAQVQKQLEETAVRREIANQLLAEKTVAKLAAYATKQGERV